MHPPDGLPTPARYHAMAAVLLAIALAVLDGTIVNLALPGIARSLDAGPAQAVWVVNAYQVATLAMLLPCATLGDLIGYRRVYLGGVLLFTLASLACVFATSLTTLAAARALQGIGAAGIMGVNAALVRLIYPAQQLGRGIALNSLVVACASVAGPTVAAGILSVASWPWLFVLNLPLGALVLALGHRALPASPARKGARLAPLDVLLNALMFGLVFLGADLLGTRGGAGHAAGAVSATGKGLAVLALGLVVGVVYVRRQLALPLPLLPVDLLRIPVFRLSMCTSVAAFAAHTLAFIALPFLLLEGYGRSHLEAGLLLSTWPLALMATAPVAGWLIGRVHNGLLGGIGLGLLAAGLALLAALPPHPGDAELAARFALCGIGFGLFQSPNNHTIVTSAPPQRSGGASGMLGTARLTGQTLGAVLLAAVFTLSGAEGVRGPTTALWLATGFAAGAAVFSLLRLRR